MKHNLFFAGLLLQILAFSFVQAQTADVKIERLSCKPIGLATPEMDIIEISVSSKNFSSSENAIKLCINWGDGKDTVAYAQISQLRSNSYLYSANLSHSYVSGSYQITVVAVGEDQKKDIATNTVNIVSLYKKPLPKVYLSAVD